MPVLNPLLVTAGGGSNPSQPPDPLEVYNNTRPADWLPMPTEEQIAEDEIYLLFRIPQGLSSLIAFTVSCSGSYTVALGTMTDGAFVQSSAQSISSGATYENTIAAADFGNITADGFAQCMIKISGTSITVWQPSAHSQKTSPSDFSSWNIVEFAARLPEVSTLWFKDLYQLRYFTLYGSNSISDMGSMFSVCYSLVSIPQLDTSAVTYMDSMFSGCYSLVSIPQLDTSAVTNMNGMFNSCSSLVSIPQLNTSAVTNMGYMFYGCSSLVSIPQLDTSAVTYIDSMFSNCNSLVSIPQLDTSAVTNMNGMFSNCNSLVSIPQLDTSAVTYMDSMFSGCYSLVSIPQLDTSAVTNMNGMFSNCNSLVSIPQLDTSAVTNMYRMFGYCYSLVSIPQLDTSAVTNMYWIFLGCNSLASILFNPAVTGWNGYAIDLSKCSLLRDGILAFFNSLPTIALSKAITLTGNPGVSDLTDADKAIATQKGWTLTL